MEGTIVNFENDEGRKVVRLNLSISPELSSADQLDQLVGQLGKMENDRTLSIRGLNGIVFNRFGREVRDPDEIFISSTSRLFHVREQHMNFIDRGDFSVSSGFGYCQAVFFQNTIGEGCFLHNYVSGHFDIPPVIAHQFNSQSRQSDATLNKTIIIARNMDDITTIANYLSHFPGNDFQYGVVPVEGFTYRVWTHIDTKGKASFKVTSDDYKNIPLSVEIKPLQV